MIFATSPQASADALLAKTDAQAGDEVAARSDAGQAAVAGAGAGPADPVAPLGEGLPGSFAARFATGAPGCVAMSPDGSFILVIEESRSAEGIERYATAQWIQRDAAVVPLGDACTPAEAAASHEPLEAYCAHAFATRAAAAAGGAELRKLAPWPPLVACHDVPAQNGKAATTIQGVPVTASAVGRRLSVRAGSKELVLVGKESTEPLQPILRQLFVADSGEAMFAAVAIRFPEDPPNEEPMLHFLVDVPMPALGLAAGCLARPTAGEEDPGNYSPPPYFIGRTPSPCQAMTRDGGAALFVLGTTHSDAGDPTMRAVWVGPGAHPSPDVSCLARGQCSQAQADAIQYSDPAGLVPCGEPSATIGFHGRRVPTVTRETGPGGGTAVLLDLGTRARHIATLGSHATLTGIYQRSGETIYILYAEDKVGPTGEPSGSADGVAVVTPDALGWCAPADPAPASAPTPAAPAAPPAGTSIAIGGATSAPVQKPVSGYRFDAANLIDGDVGTSWQPLAPTGAEGAWFELALAQEASVGRIAIANGFQRVDDRYGDLFRLNARAAAATLTFADGTHETITLVPDQSGWQEVRFAPHKTTRVRVVIDAVAEGDRWKRDLAISEIRLFE